MALYVEAPVPPVLSVELMMQCNPINYLKVARMSGLRKASLRQQMNGMCYVCFSFVCSEQANSDSFLRALPVLLKYDN